jgi:excisionase family DNA binding protein
MKYLTTNEASSRLGVSTARVRRMLKDGILAGRRFGRDWQVEETSVSARIAERKREKKKEAPSPGPPPE